MSKMLLQLDELEEMVALCNKFEVKQIEVRKKECAGIGYLMDVVIDTKVGDTPGKFVVNIADESKW